MYKNVSYSYTIVLILLFVSCFTPKTFANQLAASNQSQFFTAKDNQDLVMPVFDFSLIEKACFIFNRVKNDQINTSLATAIPNVQVLARVNSLLKFI